MTTLTDDELVTAWLHRGSLPVGEFTAPVAAGSWDGSVLRLQPTGAALADHLARRAPKLAAALKFTTIHPPSPTIAALLQDYAAATQDLTAVAPFDTFLARLATCRACALWSEDARAGRGRCDSVKCPCSARRLWRVNEQCPESKWQPA